MTEEDEKQKNNREELIKETMDDDESIENDDEITQEALDDEEELMKMLKEDEEELFRESEDGEIEELKDDAEDLRKEAVVSDDEIKDEYTRKLTETRGMFRIVIPKEIVKEKNLRPKDKVTFTTDDENDNVIVLKMYFEKDPTNFRIPFDKWKEMKYGED